MILQVFVAVEAIWTATFSAAEAHAVDDGQAQAPGARAGDVAGVQGQVLALLELAETCEHVAAHIEEQSTGGHRRHSPIFH